MKRVLLIVEDAPYGSVFAAEALRAGIAFAGMDLETRLVFVEDGVFCLNRKQDPEAFGMTGMKEGFGNAGDFGLKIFCHKESLRRRGLSKKDLIDVPMVSGEGIRGMIEESDVTIRI